MTDARDLAQTLLTRLRTAAERWPRPNAQELGHLEHAIGKLSADFQFAVLFEPFERGVPASNFTVQEYAGRLLARLQPNCPRPLTDVLRVSLPHWNLSIEQFPQYLLAVFGRDAVLGALAELEPDLRSETETRALASFRFWLGSR